MNEQMIHAFYGFIGGFLLAVLLVYIVIPAALKYWRDSSKKNKSLFYNSHISGSGNF